MSSSDHFLSIVRAPLFARRPPISAARDPHYLLRVFSLFVFILASPAHPPSPRRPLPPLLCSLLPPGRPRQRKRPSPGDSVISLSYHRPRLRSLLHRIRPRALLSSLPRLNPVALARPHPHSNVWRLKQKHLHPELSPDVCRNAGPHQTSCALRPSDSPTRSITSHAIHR